jgi:hypothetical protein
VLGQQVLQRVTGISARPVGQFGTDQRAVVTFEIRHRSRQLSGAGYQARTVGQRYDELLDGLCGSAPGHRVRPAGVVADHPAERAAAVRGRVRAEAQAVPSGGGLQRVEHESGLHPRQPRHRIEVEHRVEVAGEVEDHAGTDGVARYRRAGAPRGERHVQLAADADDRGHVLNTLWQDDGARRHPVVRRVGGIERAGPGVGCNVTAHCRA